MTHGKYRTEYNQYNLDTLREAVEAALDLNHFAFAQELVEYAGYDLCIFCLDALAISKVETPDGWLQACESCGTEFEFEA
jgi:hypothetical protein